MLGLRNKDTNQQRDGAVSQCKEQPQDRTACLPDRHSMLPDPTQRHGSLLQSTELLSASTFTSFALLDNITALPPLNDRWRRSSSICRSDALQPRHYQPGRPTSDMASSRRYRRQLRWADSQTALVAGTGTQSAAQILLINFLRTPSFASDAHNCCFDLLHIHSGLKIIQSLLSTSESIMLRTRRSVTTE